MRIQMMRLGCESSVGGEIELERTEGGVRVTHHYSTAGRFGAKVKKQFLGEMRGSERREERFRFAMQVATLVYGRHAHGGPNATNSMVHDIFSQLDAIAGT